MLYLREDHKSNAVFRQQPNEMDLTPCHGRAKRRTGWWHPKWTMNESFNDLRPERRIRGVIIMLRVNQDWVHRWKSSDEMSRRPMRCPVNGGYWRCDHSTRTSPQIAHLFLLLSVSSSLWWSVSGNWSINRSTRRRSLWFLFLGKQKLRLNFFYWLFNSGIIGNRFPSDLQFLVTTRVEAIKSQKMGSKLL